MRDLPLGMNPGVGARCANHRNRMPEDFPKCLGERLLNRGDAETWRRARAFECRQKRLFLPSVIARAAIGEEESITHFRKPQ